MKSFGVVAVMARLGIPIPCRIDQQQPRVDFFKNILVDVGDRQDVLAGRSTWTAKLDSWASIVANLREESDPESVSVPERSTADLVLLDELGSGTDPDAGGAVAQAVLEELLGVPTCRLVATTHSPRLKSLSYQHPDFDCAAVLLDDASDGARSPSFRLSYGIIGESHALAAASRCHPPLPATVLARAAELTTTGPDDGDVGGRGAYLRTLASSREEEVRRIQQEREAAEQERHAAAQCRRAMVALAAAHDDQLARQERRLADCFAELRQETSSDLKLVGDTITELRVIKKQVKSQQELLRDRGLKAMPMSYSPRPGESVVIIAKGEWEDATVEVVATADTDKGLRSTEVLVKPSAWFDMSGDVGTGQVADQPIIVPRQSLAIWDYGGAWDNYDDADASAAATSIPESRRRLNDLLSSLETEPRAAVKAPSFTSSRQRKAAKRKKRKGK